MIAFHRCVHQGYAGSGSGPMKAMPYSWHAFPITESSIGVIGDDTVIAR